MQYGPYKPYGTGEYGCRFCLCRFTALVLVTEEAFEQRFPGGNTLREQFEVNGGIRGAPDGFTAQTQSNRKAPQLIY
jgi:hypothetical protein